MSELFLVRDEAALNQCAGTKARLTSDLVFAWDARENGSLGLIARVRVLA